MKCTTYMLKVVKAFSTTLIYLMVSEIVKHGISFFTARTKRFVLEWIVGDYEIGRGENVIEEFKTPVHLRVFLVFTR
jgi:hypothetical protein